MRVIDQARLWFREGTSDKVYEVDLVEVAPGQHVVNFRFGRRGTALKDGTKTAMPLPLDKARVVFGKLVDEKRAAGYQSGTPGSAAPPPPAPPRSSSGGGGGEPPRRDPAIERILGLLAAGAKAGPEVGRAMWHAADRDLALAEPFLLALLVGPRPAWLDGPPARWQHVVVTALARCGTRASLPALETLLVTAGTVEHVRDVARIAIARIEPTRGSELARALLPIDLRVLFDRGDTQELCTLLERMIAGNTVSARTAVHAFTLLDGPIARTAVLAAARIARLENTEAQILRTLLRTAELQRDGELYVLVARRVDAYRGNEWVEVMVGGRRAYRNGAFGELTRAYFRRREARVLRRLARASSPDYPRMAADWLLAYTDADAEAPRQGNASSAWYDAWARHHVVNDIIYGQSPRYERAAAGRSAWRCKRTYRPGGPAPRQREERFPRAWDAAPEQLWRVATLGRATVIVEFAVTALRDHRAFVAGYADDVLGRVLATGHVAVQQLVFEVIQTRPVSAALARGALASQLPAAHAWVLDWVAANPAAAASDPDLVSLLVTGRTSRVRDAAIALLRRGVTPEVARSAAQRSLAILLALDGDAADAERAAGAAQVILELLAAPLRDLPAAVLRDMIAHPLAAVGELAGELMLRHDQRDTLPADLLESLLASPHAAVRAAGARILATLPPDIAKDDPQALVLFATSANAELREHTRTLVAAVAAQYPDVGRVIADRLIDALLAKQPDGAPAHIVSLLRGGLAATLPRKAASVILRLVAALSPHAREAGGLLLGQLTPDDIGLEDVARLAHNEILAVRQGAWRIARAAIDRYRIAPVAISRLVDSPWEDTRAFAMQLVTDLGTISADAIIAILDSIRPEVQALGKDLLLAQFRPADAGRYLVRLAEHPSTNIQLLVSSLLDHHLVDLAQLSAMLPYLTTILSLVNRGRVAKERVLVTVQRWAHSSEEAARLLAPLLDRQSATIAITQKHPLIATMVDVREQFPDVELPLTIVAPPAKESA